jgi:hypothetical protein
MKIVTPATKIVTGVLLLLGRRAGQLGLWSLVFGLWSLVFGLGIDAQGAEPISLNLNNERSPRERTNSHDRCLPFRARHAHLQPLGAAGCMQEAER